MQISYIQGTLLCFYENYCTAVTKTYCSLKKEQIVNMKIFVLCCFLNLRSVRGRHSKFFQNTISKIHISSAAQRSMTLCSFGGIFQTLKLYNIYFHQENLQCVTTKNSWQFQLKHTNVYKFTFIKFGFQKNNKFYLLLKVNIFFLFFKA